MSQRTVQPTQSTEIQTPQTIPNIPRNDLKLTVFIMYLSFILLAPSAGARYIIEMHPDPRTDIEATFAIATILFILVYAPFSLKSFENFLKNFREELDNISKDDKLTSFMRLKAFVKAFKSILDLTFVIKIAASIVLLVVYIFNETGIGLINPVLTRPVIFYYYSMIATFGATTAAYMFIIDGFVPFIVFFKSNLSATRFRYWNTFKSLSINILYLIGYMSYFWLLYGHFIYPLVYIQ